MSVPMVRVSPRAAEYSPRGGAESPAHDDHEPDDDHHEEDHSPHHDDGIDPPIRHGKWYNPLFRSQPMTYVAITMGTEPAPVIMRELGIFGHFHIEDLTSKDHPSTESNKYKRKVKELEGLEKRIDTIEYKITEAYKLECPDRFERPPHLQGDITEQIANYVNQLESELEPNEVFYTQTSRTIEQLEDHLLALETCEGWELPDTAKRDLKAKLKREGGEAGDDEEEELTERKRPVAKKEGKGGATSSGTTTAADEDEEKGEHKQRFRSDVVGVISTALYPQFNRMLYRISRGNAFVRFHHATPVSRGVTRVVTVFMVVVVGKDLAARIRRCAKSFNAEVFDTPPTKEGYPSAVRSVETLLTDQKKALETTRTTILELLRTAAGNSHASPLREWQARAIEERSVSDALTKCQFYLTMIACEGWVPSEKLSDMRFHVKRATHGTGHPGAVVETAPVAPIKQPKPVNPPTWFETNKYTSVFQSIVDTYGVPRYQEVNPGLFTVITFPFLFGVMYGDVGHGTLLTIASGLLIFYEKKLAPMVKKGQFIGEIGAMAYQGRYCLFLMGLFALYCGTIYNDCMSIPLAIYPTGFSDSYMIDNTTTQYYTNGKVYQFGIDWRWYHSTNMLAFMNSFKMKVAVSLGVTHMIFGIVLSLANHIYFKDKLSIYLEFLPRLVFMTFTFGYMIFMIWLKWVIDWNYPGSRPPNLIQTMIFMFLSPGNVDEDHTLYSGQAGLQVFLVLMAVFAVPVMLFGKPCYKKHFGDHHAEQHQPLVDAHSHARVEREHKSSGLGLEEGSHDGESKGEAVPAASMSPAIGDGDDRPAPEVHSFSDDMIHSGIHTIEFVLGAVSNTASYLRLWALSLAHSELAAVFWEKMLQQYGYESGNFFMTFVGFAVWFAATFGVLLCMDVLECFLHALRLHWVEFNGKFYYADGYAFDPFYFDYYPPKKI